MGVLEQVLAYKQRKEAESKASLDAIPLAVQSFQQGQQQNFDNQVKALTLAATFAKLNQNKNVYTVDPSGNLVPSGTIPSNSTIVKNQSFSPKDVWSVDASGKLTKVGQVGARDVVKQTPLGVQDIKDRTFARESTKAELPTAEAKNKYLEIQNAFSFVKDIEKLANESPSGYEGLVALGLGKITRGELGTEAMEYDKLYRAGAASLYRAVTGDMRLSDEDAADRAYRMLWNPTEGEKIKIESFKNLNNMLIQRENVYKKLYPNIYGKNIMSDQETSVDKSNIPDGTKTIVKAGKYQGKTAIRKGGKWVLA